VFFSDGPSKRLATDRDGLASSFSVGQTAQKLRSAATKVQLEGGLFRTASGTPCQRGDSWFSEWPTPCEQISDLVSAAGTRHLSLPFEKLANNFDPEFLSQIENTSSTITVDCVLSSLKLSEASGNTIFPETPLAIKGEGIWSVPIERDFPNGDYVVTIKRSCSGKIITQTKTLHIL
jgi:hypothetical protein